MAEKECIEREAAINAMCRLCSDTTRDKCSIQDICNPVCRLEAVPAADVRTVVRGKWENIGSDVWKCSSCGYGIMPWNAGVNFCPNCGAVMEES